MGASWDSNTVPGAWRDIFECSLIRCLGVIRILIPSCSTNLLLAYCAYSWDYSNELDKAGSCSQEAYAFMSYLKEELFLARSPPLTSEITQMKEFTYIALSISPA